MNTATKISLIGLGLLVVAGGTYYGIKKYSKKMTSVNQVLNSGLAGDVLWKVIAREGASKNYNDLLKLDGGTVGIAHFAYSGLGELYAHMNTQKYFNKSKEEMIQKYSKGCRPAGKKGNDTGWGCYYRDWWREGMIKFLNSPESEKIQNKAWFEKMKKVIQNALDHGWQTKRQMAIAMGIANSKGAGGFNSLASKNGWDAERTLQAYNTSDHYQRRIDAINKHFPV